MIKYNFENPKQIIGFLLDVINGNEKLSADDQLEILRCYLDFEIKEIEMKKAISNVYKDYIKGDELYE
jgi:hypothetical protein